jgi:hypothetical protein
MSTCLQLKANPENHLLDINVDDVIRPMYVSIMTFMGYTLKTPFLQHFINECPERTKPPEGYICKICNTVCNRSYSTAPHF